DFSLGDRAGNDDAVGMIRDVVLPGVFCLPRHLGTPVHAANGLTDVVSRHDLVSICAACFKARTMARFDNSILNELYSNPLASRMIASATIWKFSLVAVLPFSNISASVFRHGLCATPPSATRASLIVSPDNSSAAATDTSANA